MRTILLNLFFVLFFVNTAFTQNLQTSQFISNSNWLNPALTGHVYEQTVVSGSYRSQWNNINSPYKTVMINIESNSNEGDNTINGFGYGLSLVSDKSGDIEYKNNQILGNLNYSHYFGNGINVGLGLGLACKHLGLDQSKIQLESDIVGNSTSNTTDPLIADKLFFDWSAGLHLSYQSDDVFDFFAGASISNLNRNSNHLINDELPVAMRLKAYLGTSLQVGDAFEWQGRAFILSQNKSSNIIIGNKLTYVANDSNEDFTSYSLSVDYRIKDALVLGATIQYHGYNFFLVHDVTMSNLGTSGNYASSTELGFAIQLGSLSFNNKGYGCPYN